MYIKKKKQKIFLLPPYPLPLLHILNGSERKKVRKEDINIYIYIYIYERRRGRRYFFLIFILFLLLIFIMEAKGRR